MSKLPSAFVLSLLLAAPVLASRGEASPSGATPALVPLPAELRVRDGSFELAPDSLLVADGAGLAEASRLASRLAPATGFSLQTVEGRPARLRRALGLCHARAQDTSTCRTWIHLRSSRGMRKLGEEGYLLKVRAGGTKIRARAAAGLFYATQTLRQLLPPAIFAAEFAAGVAWSAPQVTIKDSPRFTWRGAHLDVARHFVPKHDVLRLLDALALHKLNRFHWHLTDDQGWRIEILQYPELTQVGSVRTESPVRALSEAGFLNLFLQSGGDATEHSGYYTQAEVAEVVAHAAELHITVVPEIDLPGHTQAMIAAHPELGNLSEPVDVATTYGPRVHVLNVEDSTFAFLENVLGEVMSLFPGEFIHIGGDEVLFDEWQSSPAVQAKIAELGLASEPELLGWYIDRVADFVQSQGREVVGWQNGLYADGLVQGEVVLMEWLDQADGLAAAAAGRDVVMTPLADTYLDHPWLPLSAGEQAQLEAVFGPTNPLLGILSTDLAEAYAFDPVGPDAPAAAVEHVRGGQGQLWTEFINDASDVERFAFPRLSALAEAVWTPVECRDFADFDARLDIHLERLDALGVQWRRR